MILRVFKKIIKRINMIMYIFQRIINRIVLEIAGHSTLISMCCLYWRNKTKIKKLLYQEGNVLTGVYDFGISPYALGDILTWNMRLYVQAISNAKDAIDMCIVTDASSINRYQEYLVTTYNYHNYLLEVLPAFYCNPMLRNIHFYENRESFFNNFVAMNIQGQEISPNIRQYLRDSVRKRRAYNSHDIINRFYEKNGYVPNLQVPEIFKNNAVSILKRNYNQESFFVCMHLRNRRRDPTTSALGIGRDVNLDDWLSFVDIMEKRHPEVVFMVVGKPDEWPRELYHQRNVALVKALGYGLLEELALVHECDLFMGSNSGPAVMAIFGHKPYLIFTTPHMASFSAELYEIEVGVEKLPFAREHQILKWENTSTDFLVGSFEDIFSAIKADRKHSVER